MPKVIAIASSDWHNHKWRNFNNYGQRLHQSLRVMEYLSIACQEYNVPLLFMGDLYHTPKEVENETAGKTINTYKKEFDSKKIKVYGISGNHDMSEKNSKTHVSPSHLDSFTHFRTFTKMDGIIATQEEGSLALFGVPYMNNDQDMVNMVEDLREQAGSCPYKMKILMLHSDCPGAQTPEGFEVKETDHIPWNLDTFFKEWDLVLFGHIHKPQKLSNKCYMIGSPIQQTRGDEGTDMGYWEIYDKGEPKFIHLDSFPKFITLDKGVELPDNYNYYSYPDEILVDENVIEGDFNVTKSRAKLASQYLKVKGIKSKARKKALIHILNQAE